MKLLTLVFLLATEILCFDDLSFDQWQIKYGIQFNDAIENNHREKIFLARKVEIEEHNANPTATYKKALNQFSYLDSGEFITSRCKTVLPTNLTQLSAASSTSTLKSTPITTTKLWSTYPFGNYNSTSAPGSVDFRYLMRAVQDQGNCGSCWAFAAMGQLEGMMQIRNPFYIITFGPQYLIDCDLSDDGCNGGWPTTAMNWIKSNGNDAPPMIFYPYTAKGRTCKRIILKFPLNINSVTGNYFAGDEATLKAQVANYGPQVVAIYATKNFQSYSSGVLFDNTCPSGTLNCSTVNHAVIVTGYGTDSIYGDYWQIKNSWGTSWGENGYIRLARNKDNNCNVACWPTFSM